MVLSRSLPTIGELHSRMLAAPSEPAPKQKARRRREQLGDLTPLRDRMVSSTAMPEHLKTECLERLDSVLGQLQPCSSLPRLDVCHAWTRTERGAASSSASDAGDAAAAAVAEAMATRVQEPARRLSFAPQGEAEREDGPRAPWTPPRRLRADLPERAVPGEPPDAAGQPDLAASGSRSPSGGATPGRASSRTAWTVPTHRRDWDLYWLEGPGTPDGRRASMVHKAASRVKARGSAAAAAAATATEAAHHRMPMPVLLSRSEADAHQRNLAVSCGPAPARGERGSQSGWRLRSLERNTLRSVTRT